MAWIPFALGWAAISAAGLQWAALPQWSHGLSALGWAVPVFICVLLVVAAVLVRLRGRWWWAAWLAVVAGVAAGGVSLVAAGQEAMAHRWPVAQETAAVTFSGCVVGVPQVSPGRVRFELVQLQGAAPARRLRLSWYRARVTPQGGERWEFTAKLRAPRGLVNPGSGDYALALLQAGIDATGTVREAQRLVGSGCLKGFERWRQPIDDVRATLAKRLVAAVQPPLSQASSPATPQTSSPTLAQAGTGLLLALALGLQDEVPDAQWRVFSVTGISHLVAISGLHVTLFAWLVLVAVRWVKGRGQLAPAAGLGAWSALLAVLAAFAYALLAGGNLPALRTVWMLALALTVARLRRHAGIADAWGVALVGALWLDPFAAASLGFWLSFGAVGALVWSDAGRRVVETHVIAPVAGRGSRALQRAAAVAGPFLMAQWVVTLVLAPLLAASVGLPAWVSLPVNAIAIPLFSVVLVPAVLLATVGVAVAPLVTLLLGHLVSTDATAWWVQGVATALGACVVALQWCAALPGVHWSPAAPGLSAAVVTLGLALGACTPLLSRRARAGAAVCCAAVLLWPAPRPAAGGFQLQVLDVGQGSAAVVETARHAVVFDPGPAYGPEADAGGRVVVPFLRASGWHALAAVVVSHADADHAAGLGQVLQRFPEATVWWGGDGGAAAHGRQPCRAGLQWRLDGVEFTFLHPGAAPERDDNSGSCVLLVRAAGRSALLLADIPQRIEAQLVAAGPLPVDIVLVAHHGSATASGEALRTATQVPEGGHAVVSAGYRNRWAFPKPAVRAGWQAVGRQVWVTAEEGALQFEVAPNGALRVAPLRRLEPRWWRPALLAAPT